MSQKALRIFMVIIFLAICFQSFAQAEESTRVIVTVIRASNDGSDFDLENDAYRDELIQLFSYTFYKQLNRVSVDLKGMGSRKVTLPGGYELVLTFQGTEEDRVLVEAAIRKGDEEYVRSILSSLKPGVAFLGGPLMDNGAMIIVLEIGF